MIEEKIYKKIAPLPTVSPKTVSGIDALNFHCKIDYTDYTNFYNNILLNKVLEDDDTLQIDSKSNYDRQYVIFNYTYTTNATSEASEKGGESEANDENLDKISFCRIWFKNLNIRDNLDSILIKINSIVLQMYSIDDIYKIVQDKLFEFGLTILQTKINRLDLNTYVYGFDFDWLDYDYFSTLSRKNAGINSNFYDRSKLLTFGIGNRDSKSVFLRIYNKWRELVDLSRKDYHLSNVKRKLIEMKFLKEHYIVIDEDLPLWNIEYELKREKLKQYSINTLEDVKKLSNSLFNMLCTKSFKLLSRQTFKGDTNKSKIPFHPVWKIIIENYNYNDSSLVDISKIKAKKYEKDSIWLKNRINDFLNTPINNDKNLNNRLNLILSELE